MSISKPRMALKFLRLFFYRIVKRGWYLPKVPEITADELFEHLNSGNQLLIVDLRERKHFEGLGETKYDKHGHIKGAKWIPIMELSTHFEEFQPFINDLIVTICPGGGMSLVAAELMTKAGFKDVRSLKGGIWAYAAKGYPLIKATEPSTGESSKLPTKKILNKYQDKIHHTVDARGLSCPRPVLMSKKALNTLKTNQILEILTTDPGSLTDIPSWAHVTGNQLLASEERGPKDFRFVVRKQG